MRNGKETGKGKMTDLSSNVSMITLNINSPNSPVQGRDWLHRSKHSRLFTVYKKFTSYSVKYRGGRQKYRPKPNKPMLITQKQSCYVNIS